HTDTPSLHDALPISIAYEVGIIVSGFTSDQFIGNRLDSERFSVDNHIFQFNAIGLKQVDARGLNYHRLVLILFRRTSIIMAYNLSFNTLSSVPASILGLSLTSIT